MPCAGGSWPSRAGAGTGRGDPFRPLRGLSFFNCLLPDIWVYQTSQLIGQTGGSLFKWIHSNLVPVEAVNSYKEMMSFLRECLKARGTGFR